MCVNIEFAEILHIFNKILLFIFMHVYTPITVMNSTLCDSITSAVEKKRVNHGALIYVRIVKKATKFDGKVTFLAHSVKIGHDKPPTTAVYYILCAVCVSELFNSIIITHTHI